MASPEMKTDMSKIPTALYLHGGPGLNCAVERAWFGDTYPVLWWDQPRFPADAENAYQATLDAALEKLAELHTRQGKPIQVIGWSFGARLGLDLAHCAPNSVGALTLLAPTLCLETAFGRMADYLAAKGAGDPAPWSALGRSGYRKGNHEDFMQLGMAILSTPDLLSLYWAPTSAALFERHGAEAARTEWFDLPTFTALSREIIKRPVNPLTADRACKIRIIAGRHDPYFDPETDLNHWKNLFPEASIQIVDSGHMLPFECPATEWLNPAPYF